VTSGTGTTEESPRWQSGVNFINILRTHFSHKSSFLAHKFCTKAVFGV